MPSEYSDIGYRVSGVGSRKMDSLWRNPTPDTRNPSFSIWIATTAVILFIAGCGAPRMGQPLAKNLAASDPDAQMNYWHSLTDQPITTNDEAFHGLLLYADRTDESADYAARVAKLKSRKWLSSNFNEPATAAVRRGTLAVALMQLMHQKGGLTMRIFGPSPRYATREMMFLNLYPPSTPNQSFSGNEFVGIIGRVEDFQNGNPANVPAAVMPDEMNQQAATQPATQPVRQ